RGVRVALVDGGQDTGDLGHDSPKLLLPQTGVQAAGKDHGEQGPRDPRAGLLPGGAVRLSSLATWPAGPSWPRPRGGRPSPWPTPQGRGGIARGSCPCEQSAPREPLGGVLPPPRSA